MKVNVNDFLNKYATKEYRYGIYIPKDINEECNKIKLNTILNDDVDPYIEIPDNIDEVIDANKRKDEQREALYNEISSHRLNGMNYEEQGLINRAIEEYALSIEIGEQTDIFHAYAYSYTRIVILLSKLKKYELEIIYISQYLKHNLSDREVEKYHKRLEKIKSKVK